MPNWPDPIEIFVRSHAEEPVHLALTDTRIVAMLGPLQSGMTTLDRRIADDDGRTYVSLDYDQFRRSAQEDQLRIVRDLQTAEIDEI